MIEETIPLVRSLVGRKVAKLPAHIDADDLFQEAMEQVVRAAARYNPTRAAFSSYIYRRAEGAMQDYARREQGGRTGARTHALPLDAVPEPGTEDSDEAVRLYDAIATLPPVLARAIWWHLAGYTGREIAAAEGVHETRITQRLNEARALLAAGLS